jgi:hypothetical protein
MVTRYNRKSVTVVTDAGQRWNVAPSLLRGVDPDERTVDHAKVVRLKRE